MPLKKDGYYPFNGFVGDTVIWAPAASEKYIWDSQACVERLRSKVYCIPVGFFWLHFGPLKNGQRFDDYAQGNYILLEDLPKAGKEILIRRNKILKKIHGAYQKPFKRFWEKDRLLLSKDIIEVSKGAALYFSEKKERIEKVFIFARE